MTTLTIADKPITWQVYYKSTWAAAWSQSVNTHPTSVIFTTGNEIATATLIRDFGKVNKLGVGRGTISPLNLAGKFIKIILSKIDSDGITTTRNWFGYCPAPADRIDGTRQIDSVDVTKGKTTYSCYGLEWLLRDTRVLQVTDVDSLTVKRNISFNYVESQRYSITKGNRSAAKNGDSIYTFDQTNNAEWTGLDVVEHLLFNWSDQTGGFLTWDIEPGQPASSTKAELANIEGVWNFEGQNYLSAIQQIINPSNAFTFAVTVDEGSNKAIIKVFPAVDSSIVEGAVTIVTQNNLSVGLLLDTDPDIKTANVRHLDQFHYDKIEVRGGLLRTCFTVAIAGGTYYNDAPLDEGWTAADETTYNNAADDNARAIEDLEDVYTRFTMPLTWDGVTNTEFAFPTIDEDTGKVDDPAIGQIHYLGDKVFDRTLPWTEIQNETQPRRPFAFYSDADGYWHRIDKPGDETTHPVGLKVLDDQLGIQLVTGSRPNHIVALNDFTGSSEVSTEWDFTTLLTTVSMVTDEYTRVVKTASTPEPGQLERRKIIEVPELQVWYVVPGTVKSIDTTQQGLFGLVVTTDSDADKYARDDSAKMLRIANLANEFYGRTRQTLDVVYANPWLDDYLGYFISEAQTGQATQPINTIITKMAYTLGADSQEMLLTTDFFDLDIVRVAKGRSRRGFSGNMRSSDELANIPVRVGNGSVAGSAASYVSVTYDSGTQQFTLAVSSMPYVSLFGRNTGTVMSDQVFPTIKPAYSSGGITKTFKFNKPATNQALTIYAAPQLENGDVDLFSPKINLYWSATTLVGSDSTTTSREIDSWNNATRLIAVTLNSDGTYSSLTQPTNFPVVVGSLCERPGIKVITSSRTIYVDAMIDPVGLGTSANGFVYAEPFDDDIILGFNNGDTSVSVDSLANAGSYASYFKIGEVKINASNGIDACKTYPTALYSPVPHMGFTGTFTDNDLNTITVRNGLVTNKA